MIRIALPFHLQTLAGTGGEVTVKVSDPVTLTAVLDALESKYPMLCGTVREHVTLQRRPRVRFYADGEDISHDPPDVPLAGAIVRGDKPLMIVGAISGG
ncbi:MAG: MoaD/ThiS family protein [Woeseia sp.]